MLLLKNGKILDGNNELIATDLLIEDGKVTKIEAGIEASGAEVVELDGKLITPGLIDVHVHLREPGGEHKETIATGTASAARGGYTLIASMPNTIPSPDSRANVDDFLARVKKDAVVRVIPYGAITKDIKGEAFVDFAEVADDVLGFTDDGKGLQTAGQKFHAMQEAVKVGKPILSHCEDESILFGGYLHEGKYSQTHGHKGILSAVESIHVSRDALLAQATGAHYHVFHISTKESVSLVRWAKAQGINITAEVSPHHLLLSEEDIPTSGNIANWKMNPPLRGLEDKLACIEGFLDGTIDIIATDHAPHTEEEKSAPIDQAPLGIVGLETAFPLLYTHFVKTGKCTLQFLLDRMAKVPAELFNLPYGKLKVGAHADIAVFDLEKEYAIDKHQFVSKGKNTPFDGWPVTGDTYMTIVDGRVAYKEKE